MTLLPSSALLAVALLLAACAEPYDQPGTWHATGVNQANLDAQAIDNADTVAGHGESGSDGVLDEQAVRRLYDGKAKALRSETTTSIMGGSGSGSQ